MGQVVSSERKPRSVILSMAERYDMEPDAFEATVRATCSPVAKGGGAITLTREQFAAFLLVAKDYDLNPLLKEIYAFPTRNGGIQPIVSVDGWMNLINRQAELDGLEFDDHLTEKGELTAITARIWRKDRAKPIVITEYMVECERETDTWKKWPRRMLRHKAAIQCARYAFGFSGIMEPDEFERSDIGEMRDVTPLKPPPAPTAVKEAETIHVPLSGRARKEKPQEPVQTAPQAKADDTPKEREASTGPADEPERDDSVDIPLDPDRWLDDIMGRMRSATTSDLLNEIWTIDGLPRRGELPKPDFEEADDCYHACLEKLGG